MVVTTTLLVVLATVVVLVAGASPRSAANCSSSAGSSHSPVGDAGSISALSDQEAEAHEALAHEAADWASLAHEADAHEALAQEAEAQLALDQEAEAHEAEAQEALAQEAFADAVLAQLAESKTLPPLAGSVTTKVFSARFGFGALVRATALATSTTPTPTDSGAASLAGRAVSMIAPLTWSGVHVGWLARIWAAAPATTGAAKDVPESWMYPGETMAVGFSSERVEVAGAGPTM